MSKVLDLVEQLEDLAELLNKAQTNFKKCSKVRKTKGYLNTRVQCIDSYWDTFRQTHVELVKVTTKEERSTLSYFTSDVHSECEELYTCLKAEILDCLQQFELQSQPMQPGSSYVPSTKQSTSTNPEVKLPRINLPSFGGAYDEWQSFEDTFTSLIHNNHALNDVQKLHYLKSCVIGEAKNTIKHFQITEKNYLPAWENLKNRYSQRRLIVNAILRKLFTLRKLTSPSPVHLKSLIDNTKESLNSLNSLDISTTSWDPIIIFIVIQKLDSESHRAWETYVSEEHCDGIPTFVNLTTFLDSRICTLELTSSSSQPMARDKLKTFHANTSAHHTCILCSENHLLCHCKQFGKLDPDKRSDYVRENRLCYNCLAPGHSMMFCRQKTSCRVCGRRHHSLLHSFSKKHTEEKKQAPAMSSLHANVEESQEEDQDITDIATHFASHFTSNRKSSLLATAVVPVRSSSGQTTLLRALIDLGSEASFVSERAAQRLQVIKTPAHARITGIGSTETQVSHSTQLEVLSRYEDSFSLNVEVYIVSKPLTKQLPSKTIAPISWSHLEGLILADPKYNIQGKIDMLLGVQVYADIVKGKIIKGPSGSPCAQETSLGWILFGKVREESHDDRIIVHHHLEIDVHTMLKNMWHIEETSTRSMTAEERQCEEIYTATHSRTIDGRYVVKLPLKSAQPIDEIGETREIALKRFYQLERRLESKPKLKEEYSRVIDEYLQLNHMEEVPREERSKSAVYLPHHAVVREDKETTKVRIVFDGSCKGSNGKSLNDELMVGPQLQNDLRDLIMRWRMKPVCFTADIKMMYRQLLVKKEDADLQRILWRKNSNEEVKEYRILRVMFGTAAAPYLSVRTLMQIADDEGKELPEGARVIKEEFFVDDCMSGSVSAKKAIQLSKEITTVLEKGGFILQKWASNSPEFIAEIEPTLRSIHATQDLKNECMIKTLGLSWNMKTDTLHYRFEIPTQPKVITKRNILADIQRFFDPLGWISPAIVLAKILIQKLWLQKLEWDDTVNETIANDWIKLRKGFEKLNDIHIDRWIKTNNEDLLKTTLHGFSDASEKAYCAVVYARVETKDGNIMTSIIASKTRVAPVKSITLPRLELCGALLLSKLLTQVCEAMKVPKDKVYAWTDSSVVLSWLFGDPHRWKLFVSNRVIEILDNVTNTQWFHVASKDNPADVGSRGRELPLLIESKLWWEGPEWLKTKEIKLTRPNIKTTDMERKKTLQVNLKIDHTDEETITFENFDTLQELKKVITYSIRFINSKKHPERIEENISTEEYEEALMKCIKIAQFQEFGPEIERLQQKRNLRKDSKALNLNPYLDEKNILRVGGRLRNSDLETEQKHPIILGTRTHLTSLIIADAHKKTLHGGVQLMLCYLRSKYWIIHAKNAVKACIHKCLICARQRAVTRTQIMGDLPKVRVTQARPFLHSGVDFAGPLQVLMSKGRGAKSNKAYIAIFICMATKAIHLELVGDLSSESFIGAFQRFVARRGKCTHIWSDQGRNFIGANRELAEAFKEACLELPGDLADILSSDGTQWHHIPAYSPNFGGLWESGVKSTKHHLKRILTKNLTFEEMTTTLCQIEACLNSRPLVPVDASDPDVIEPLTPGHFLIGEPPVVIPSPDLRDVNINKLSRWQYTQKLVKDFWYRWQSEFITRLQERPKWMKRQKELEPGDIVIVKEDGLPPGKWSLGRITQKHVGPDGHTRVYSLKCRGDIIKRTNTRLCQLPIDKSE